MDKVLFIIPARSGSTRVKNKNTRKLTSTDSLLTLKIKCCLKTKLGKVLVSTDSEQISKIAKKNGAIVPFLRPKKLSDSKATMMSCVINVINYYKEKKNRLPDYLAIMPPTYPFTNPLSIKKAFDKLKKHKKYNSLCSYSASNEHPFSYVGLEKKKIKFNYIKYRGKVLSEYERTQDYPNSYVLSGSIRITKLNYLEKFIKNTSPYFQAYVIDFNSCIGYELNKREAYDINTKGDFNIAKFLYKNKRLLT